MSLDPSGAGIGTGHGLEILALTAAVVGGNSLGGGRGSIVKGLMGAIIVLVMTNGLIRLGYGTGTNQMVLGILLAAAVTIDIRWLKNCHKVLNEMYVAPVYLKGTSVNSRFRLLRGGVDGFSPVPPDCFGS
ncbi:hypothetical protein [Profundibacter sp.]|uniref:hypothetical protein n=1 Tax=Profundibacter sp. TaxID=3101071 RepID=UPI003D151416